MPFQEVAVDRTGPWIVQITGRPHMFHVLSVIDTGTNLVETGRLDNKTSEHVIRNFDQVCQSRYSWPDRSVHENKEESTRWKFQELLEQATITDVPTTTYNPQSNAVCEHMHQTVGNVL